jgi:hypothetical protein
VSGVCSRTNGSRARRSSVKSVSGQRIKAAALNEKPNGPIRGSRLLQQNLPCADSCNAKLRATLCDLSDRELMDIGTTRGEIDYVASNRDIDPRGIRSAGSGHLSFMSTRPSIADQEAN